MRMRICEKVLDCVVSEIPDFHYYVVADSDGCLWRCQREDLRRLVKRKRPKPAAPDRVMVAAAVFGGLLGETGERNVASWSKETLCQTIADAFTIADALIAEGAK